MIVFDWIKNFYFVILKLKPRRKSTTQLHMFLKILRIRHHCHHNARKPHTMTHKWNIFLARFFNYKFPEGWLFIHTLFVEGKVIVFVMLGFDFGKVWLVVGIYVLVFVWMFCASGTVQPNIISSINKFKGNWFFTIDQPTKSRISNTMLTNNNRPLFLLLILITIFKFFYVYWFWGILRLFECMVTSE